MPMRICENNHLIHYRNTRGSSAPKICPVCAQPLTQAQYDVDTQQWKPRKGKTRENKQ